MVSIEMIPNTNWMRQFWGFKDSSKAGHRELWILCEPEHILHTDGHTLTEWDGNNFILAWTCVVDEKEKGVIGVTNISQSNWISDLPDCVAVRSKASVITKKEMKLWRKLQISFSIKSFSHSRRNPSMTLPRCLKKSTCQRMFSSTLRMFFRADKYSIILNCHHQNHY